MSARDELIEMLDDEHTVSYWGPKLSAYRNEIKNEDAAIVRAAKVREPIDEAEEYLNAALEDVARAIERGRG
ncbi:hypothetical protein [Streptomyces sp. NPDC059009]|uniref:hypothetical protein n=1 Tax=Streptomyces sp. NPDC059009 TaxID=3346694 RepID=UPI00368CEB58